MIPRLVQGSGPRGRWGGASSVAARRRGRWSLESATAWPAPLGTNHGGDARGLHVEKPRTGCRSRWTTFPEPARQWMPYTAILEAAWLIAGGFLPGARGLAARAPSRLHLAQPRMVGSVQAALLEVVLRCSEDP